MTEILLALLMTAQPLPQSVAAPEFLGRLSMAQSWSCQPRKTCGRIAHCEEARWYLENCSWGYRLDGDSDGIPCESLCGGY